jgi:hypothetical protein
MPEPTTTAATVTAATAAGIIVAATTVPGLADYALLVFGALVGAMHSVSKIDTPTRLSAGVYVVKWVATAAVLTFAVAAVLESYLALPAQSWPGVVAFGITYLADRWPGWVTDLLQRRLGLPGPQGAQGGEGGQ